MFKTKKFITIAVLGIAIIGGSIGGAVLADDGDDGATWPGPQRGGNLERVCEIYHENTGDEIDCDELGIAFRAAADERMGEFRANIQQRLIEEGVLTEDELEAYQEWLAERPDRDSDDFEAWMEDCPVETPLGPGGFSGRGGRGGFTMPRGGAFPRFGGADGPYCQ